MDVAIFAKLKEWLGTKTDTGGSPTDGTVNGKLNAVITNTEESTSANASGTLSQKLTYLISSLIGATGSTGGSPSAGTVMAKLNALLTSWTSTRAGYIDQIRNYTVTNNTESSTGVLSQKLSYLISQRQASLTGEGISVFSYNPTTPIYSGGYICIAKFVAPQNGLYKVVLGSNAQSYSTTIRIKRIIDAVSAYCYNATNTSYSYVGTVAVDQNSSYDASTVNGISYAAKVATTNTAWDGYISERGSNLFSLMPNVGWITTSSVAATGEFYINCKAGERVQLVAEALSSRTYYIHSVNITYQGK